LIYSRHLQFFPFNFSPDVLHPEIKSISIYETDAQLNALIVGTDIDNKARRRP